jgi:hypothetical protein
MPSTIPPDKAKPPRHPVRHRQAGAGLARRHAQAERGGDEQVEHRQVRLPRRPYGVRLETEREFGLGATLGNHVLGPILLWSSKRETRGHRRGRPREPRTFVERRSAAVTT